MDFQQYTRGGLYLPAQALSEQRTPSEDFVETLRDLDPRLIVTWNRLKHRWVVEECMQHAIEAPSDGHCHLCRRSYVWLVQDPEGGPMPLGSRVIEELRGMDIYKKFDGPEGIVKAMDEIDRKNQEAEKKQVREHIQGRKKDNKRQLEQAITLIDRHDFFGPVHN